MIADLIAHARTCLASPPKHTLWRTTCIDCNHFYGTDTLRDFQPEYGDVAISHGICDKCNFQRVMSEPKPEPLEISINAFGEVRRDTAQRKVIA